MNLSTNNRRFIYTGVTLFRIINKNPKFTHLHINGRCKRSVKPTSNGLITFENRDGGVFNTFLNIENLLPWRWKLFGVDLPMFIELYLQFGVRDFWPFANPSGEQEEETWICFGVSVWSESIFNWSGKGAFESNLLLP